MVYDIAVIGGGPAGYSGALKAAQLGAKVVVFEGGAVGGTCLNVGCIPTKCYVSQAELIEKIKQNTKKGIFKEAGLFSYKKIFEEKERVVAQLTKGVASLLGAAGVTLVKANADITEDKKITAGGEVYEAKNIVIATGSVNAVPPIPGIKGKNVLDSTGLLALSKRPKSIAIVGAGVIGMEFACVLNALGSEVTAIDVLPSILSTEDGECAKTLERELKRKGIKFMMGSRVKAIEDDGAMKRVVVEKDGKESAVTAEYVLVGVGRKPVSEIAAKLGCELDARGFVKVNENMETSVKNVYAAGDVAGGYLLAHAAYEEAETAVQNCMGADKKVDVSIMPRCIFTMPSFAAVGLTEEAAKEKCEVATGKFPFAASGKALAGGATEGFVKWVAEKESGKLLGCHILGAEAAELINAAVVAINMGATVDDFEHMIFPHPTLSESVKEGALACFDKALHIPAAKKR